MTNDRNGSKFLADWTLPVLVAWIEEQVWVNGAKTRVRVPMNREIGYVEGQVVRTITITVSGRWVYAYPDKDQP